MTKKSEIKVSAGLVEQTALGDSQLLAIMFVDACGSSRIMRNNEGAALQSIGREMDAMKRLITDYKGNLCSFRGDGLLVSFKSAGDAVGCGLAIQKRKPPELFPLKFRVGIHIGDTFKIDGQPMGDSVNVAARVESQADPGGILVSRPVYEALRGSLKLKFVSVGKPYLKNIGDDLELFQVLEQSAQDKRQQFDLQLIGSFAITDPNGVEIAISSESKAILTTLALSYEGLCGYQWLKNTIWYWYSEPDREVNLETALENLRVAFGQAFDDVLNIGPSEIMMVQEAVSCDVVQVKKYGWNKTEPMPELLKGYNFRSAAFKVWLLHQQSLLRSAICLRDSEYLLTDSIDTSSHTDAGTHKLIAIGLLPARTDGDNAKAGFAADLLADWLVRSLSETEAVEILDYRDGSNKVSSGNDSSRFAGPDVLIECRSGSAGDMAQIAVNILRAEDRKLIWSQSMIAEQKEFIGPSGTNIDMFISYATDALLSMLASGKHMRNPSAHHAAKSAIGAVHRLLTMTGPGLDRVEADIMTAYEIDPKPIYLAWLAYMSTFHVGERYGSRDAEFEEQTRALARRALEADPHNALVLGLVAHVHSYVFHEFSFADDLISRALETNPFRSMTWDTAALLYSYTGRPNEAMQAALNARRLGQHSPYRHLFDGACCVAALVNGRFKDAVKYGESVMAVQPEFKSVLRYLAASYGHLGNTEHARLVMQKLIQLEPDLSIECLRDGSYPVPSKASAQLIETGLSRIGLPLHP